MDVTTNLSLKQCKQCGDNNITNGYTINFFERHMIIPSSELCISSFLSSRRISPLLSPSFHIQYGGLDNWGTVVSPPPYSYISKNHQYFCLVVQSPASNSITTYDSMGTTEKKIFTETLGINHYSVVPHLITNGHNTYLWQKKKGTEKMYKKMGKKNTALTTTCLITGITIILVLSGNIMGQKEVEKNGNWETKVAGFQFDPVLSGIPDMVEDQPSWMEILDFTNGDIFTLNGYQQYSGTWGYSPDSPKPGWKSCVAVGLGAGAHAVNGIAGHLTLKISEEGTYTLGVDDQNLIFGNPQAEQLGNEIWRPHQVILVNDCLPEFGFTGLGETWDPVQLGDSTTLYWTLVNDSLVYRVNLNIQAPNGYVSSHNVTGLDEFTVTTGENIYGSAGKFDWWLTATMIDTTMIDSEVCRFTIVDPSYPPSGIIKMGWGELPEQICINKPFTVDLLLEIPAGVKSPRGNHTHDGSPGIVTKNDRNDSSVFFPQRKQQKRIMIDKEEMIGYEYRGL